MKLSPTLIGLGGRLRSGKDAALAERFVSLIGSTAEGGCLVWGGAKNYRGYGQIHVDGATAMAHRVSYELFVADVPPGHYIMHSCDTPACVAPDHLSAGTQKENIDDMMAKGRGSNGGLSGSPRKINRRIADEIRASSEPNTVLARRHGISGQMVSLIKRRKAWTSERIDK